MRVAVVDIGSNSTRLLIADVSPDGRVTERQRRSEVTRLGDGVDANARLSEQAIERVTQALDGYAFLIEQEACDRKVAVLTSAVRDASNGPEFVTLVGERYGLDARVIPGEEEAQLTFLGAMSERSAEDPEPTVVIDIGGGSTEFIIGRGRQVEFHVSTQAGVVRQTERHIDTDPPTDEELRELGADVRSIVADAVPSEWRRRLQHAIGVAGTATSLAAIAQRLDPYDPACVHGYRLRRDAAQRILGELAAIPVAERRKVPGLHPDRAPTIVAGVVIFLTVLDLFGLEEIEVSEHDILRGAVLGLTVTESNCRQ
jgi:exopolyphosphatase/guanosine-5'-triphosphate,3'-diphosphate pyrophosphatase